MIKAIIVDDEKNSRLVLSQFLSEHFCEIKIYAEAEDVQSAIAAIEKHKPDLVFLDIDLPDGTGFDILEKVNNKKFKVIFITAHEEYAIKAIKFSAFDYILKPINSQMIIETVSRVLQVEAENYELKLDAFNSNKNNSSTDDKKIVLTTSAKIYVVNVKEIIRCESDNNYTNFYLTSGKNIMVSKTIKTYDEILSEFGFLRVHQTHLVNKLFISEFDKSEGGYVVLTNGDKIPVSHNKKSTFFNYFSSL